MLRPLVLSLMVSGVAVPAMAQDIKPEVEKIGAAYTDCVAKHDGACVASLYSKDGIQVNVVGEVKTDLKATYEGYFKDGEDKIAVKVNYAQPLGNDMALAAGDVDVTFNVEPKLRPLFWSAVYIKEGGQWKIRMLTAAVKPPPPPVEANADKK
jgi:ketosteroid isomerase-like protein